LFFAGSLASRAVSASLTARESGSTVVRADGAAATTPSLRLPAALIGGLAAAVVLGVSLGGRGGPLELLGRIVLPALGWAIVGVSYLFGLVGQGLRNLTGWLHL